MAKSKKCVISLSFKEDERWLYEIITKYSSPTGTIKDILKDHFKNNSMDRIKIDKSDDREIENVVENKNTSYVFDKK